MFNHSLTGVPIANMGGALEARSVLAGCYNERDNVSGALADIR